MASELQSALSPFLPVANDPYRFAKQAHDRGERVAGVMCSYSPQELLHSAGYFPIRLLGKEGGTPLADQWIQPFACSFARSVFNIGLENELSFLDLVMFSHTCDTMQNLADLWRRRIKTTPVIIVSTPNVNAGNISLNYLKRELLRVKQELEQITQQTITDDQLRQSIQLFNQHRNLMMRLYTLRREKPGVLTGTEMFNVVLASFLMKKEDHLALLENLIQIMSQTPAPESNKPKILVGGSVCQAQGFIQSIESAGALVIDDDLCMGSRTYILPEISDTDPIECLARMYLSRIPCPAVHHPGYDPAEPLIQRIQASSADGVVFLQTKFCDPYAFNYPYLHRKLDERGIPNLLVEVEQNQPVPETFRTRIEAFIETIQR